MQNAGHVYVHVIPAVETGAIRVSMAFRKPRVEAWNTHAVQLRSPNAITQM